MDRRATRSLKSVAIVIYVLLGVCRVNGGLTLYIAKKFAENRLGLAINNDIFLINNGKKHPEASRPLTNLSSDVDRIEMTWFAAKHNVNYSLRVISSDLNAMHQPRISPIPLQGTIRKDQTHQTFEITLPCTGLVEGAANLNFTLDYTHFHKALKRFLNRTFQFVGSKRCVVTSTPIEMTTEATPKQAMNRTIVVTISGVLACIVCVLVGVVFFWRFIKRIRKKFGFDDLTESLSRRSEVLSHSPGTVASNSQLPTVIYSPKRQESPNTFFTKIAKCEEKQQLCCSTTSTTTLSNPSRLSSQSAGLHGQFVGCSSSENLRLFTQVSLVEDDVFISEQWDAALIENEQSARDATITLAKESDNKKEMFATLNEYWATKLGDSLLSREDVEIRSEVIGEGEFGCVRRGKLRNTRQVVGGDRETKQQQQCVDVAVKVCQDDIEFEQMVCCVNEAILMKSLAHENLLDLLGVVLQPACPPLILTPLSPHGDLHKFLRHSRGVGIRRQLIGSRQLINFASQIARGMAYLAGQKIVHRDLAARNCLVDDDLKIKIGDFGLARSVGQLTDLFKMEHPTRLAVKWLALESLLYYMFNEKSDVWSFGIVLWELVTLGSQPYAGLDNCEVTPFLETGKRLSRPLRCPDDLYSIMSSCWSASPESRPSFSILVHKLEDYELRLRPGCIAFEFDEDTIEMTDDCDFGYSHI